MRAEWRSASVMCGVLCVILDGALPMLQLCVVSLDTREQVSWISS